MRKTLAVRSADMQTSKLLSPKKSSEGRRRGLSDGWSRFTGDWKQLTASM